MKKRTSSKVVKNISHKNRETKALTIARDGIRLWFFFVLDLVWGILISISF
jgi:hypothetical protein